MGRKGWVDSQGRKGKVTVSPAPRAYPHQFVSDSVYLSQSEQSRVCNSWAPCGGISSQLVPGSCKGGAVHGQVGFAPLGASAPSLGSVGGRLDFCRYRLRNSALKRRRLCANVAAKLVFGGTSPMNRIRAARGWRPNHVAAANACAASPQGYGVYRFAGKYGTNVDGYSPIYTPDIWSKTGDSYDLGTRGLIAWAIVLAVGFIVGVNVVLSTSALS
eukprot:evm.model.scf_344.5 EVM.evm.TU.scf_344.5   scf_344:55161-56977(+)